MHSTVPCTHRVLSMTHTTLCVCVQVKEAILSEEAYCAPETAVLLASYAVSLSAFSFEVPFDDVFID